MKSYTRLFNLLNYWQLATQ